MLLFSKKLEKSQPLSFVVFFVVLCRVVAIVPKDWKQANVVLVYKKRNHQHPSNYRPISLTSIASKLFEKIISSHIVKYLESHNTLYDLQHGFHQHRSCETQILTLIHELMTNFDKNIQSDLILMDFAKAFDTVPTFMQITVVWCVRQYLLMDSINPSSPSKHRKLCRMVSAPHQ